MCTKFLKNYVKLVLVTHYSFSKYNIDSIYLVFTFHFAECMKSMINDKMKGSSKISIKVIHNQRKVAAADYKAGLLKPENQSRLNDLGFKFQWVTVKKFTYVYAHL